MARKRSRPTNRYYGFVYKGDRKADGTPNLKLVASGDDRDEVAARMLSELEPDRGVAALYGVTGGEVLELDRAYARTAEGRAVPTKGHDYLGLDSWLEVAGDAIHEQVGPPPDNQ